MTASALSVLIGLWIANFGYEWLLFSVPNYSGAVERSFFQMIAIIAFLFVLWLNGKFTW